MRRRVRRLAVVLVAVVAAFAVVLPATATAAPASVTACKSGLTNQENEAWGWAKVVTEWCYSGGHVTSRHSERHAQISAGGYLQGWLKVETSWRYSACHNYNGYWNHNCLTRAEVHAWNKDNGQFFSCIHTRIYGNGAHSRLITQGLCP